MVDLEERLGLREDDGVLSATPIFVVLDAGDLVNARPLSDSKLPMESRDPKLSSLAAL